MTNDDLNTLKNIHTTFENALVQKDLLGEIPCHVCNSNGVFNYSPIKDCICDGKAWLHKAQ